jgi:5-oxoprolinase (ATP-hydrolysing) subunit A
MVTKGKVRSTDGTDVSVQADTLCIHGDEPGAVEFARRIRAALEEDGVRVAPMS